MNLVELLPEEERKSFRYYAQTTSGAYDEQISDEHILRFWNDNKADLYRVLGNNFIISKEVMVQKSYDDLCDEIECKLFSLPFIKTMRMLKQDMKHKGNDYFYQPNMRDRADEYYAVYYALEFLLSFKSLIKNKAEIQLQKKYEIIPGNLTKSGKKIKVEDGSKPIKMLEKIAKEFDMYNEKDFEEFRLAHSQILNNKMLKGNLCLSIHPLDYATMSDNFCHWTSCMNWEDGDYRQGTVEMMNSPYVVVAYLTSSRPYRVCDFEWNSKKWRKLYVVAPEIIMGIKGYPYQDDNLDKIILNWLRELASQTEGFGPYEEELINASSYDTPGNKIVHLYMNYMYSDISSNHKAYLRQGSKEIELDVSGQAECLQCGKDCSNGGIAKNSIVCFDCGDYQTCDCCGESHPADSINWYTMDNGDCICEYCFEEETMNCEHCDALIYNVDDRTICLEWGENSYQVISVCDNCFEWYKKHFEVIKLGCDTCVKLMSAENEEILKKLPLYFQTLDEIIECWRKTHDTNKEEDV